MTATTAGTGVSCNAVPFDRFAKHLLFYEFEEKKTLVVHTSSAAIATCQALVPGAGAGV